MLKIRYSTQFKKDFRTIQKRGYDTKLLEEVVTLLSNGMILPPKYKDHSLVGAYKGYRDCHITPDWVLIYKIEQDILTLILTRTGTLSDLY